MKIATLSNGVRVANFSSPHSFTFTDGTVLDAHSAEDANLLKVNFIEDIDKDGDVSLTFSLSVAVMQNMDVYIKEYKKGRLDKVLIPLPMMTAIKNLGWNPKVLPFRCVRIEDRTKRLVSIEKWCI